MRILPLPAIFLVLGAALPAALPTVPPGRLAFQTYGAAQGLANLNIWALTQDPDGFLWVGTADGLFQYDGSRFQGWGMEEGLPSPFVRALLPEGGGRLWIGTARGLALREAGRIRALRTDKGLPEGEVFALAKDSQGRLWVAMDVGLFRQIPGADRFEGAPGWGQGKLARALLMDGSSLLVAHQEHLLAYDVTRGGAPRELPGPWKERLDSLLKDRQGRLWVRSRAGLWMRPGDQAPFQDLSGRLKPATYDGNLALTPGGDLLIPTLENLVRVRGDEWKAVSMGQGLPSSWTNRAMEDREGCLWVGGLGLHRDLARQSWRQHTIQDGITGGVVWTVIKDARGTLLAGTTNGLCEAHGEGWKQVPGTAGQAFLSLALAPDGAIWMGGAPARLRRWVPGTGQWLELPRPTSTITNILFAPDGALWVATRREGLFRVTREGRGYRVDPFLPPGAIPGERIQSMVRREGRVWMASTNGLLLLEGGRWLRLGPREGLLSAKLRSAYEAADGSLWVSYEDRQGISCFQWSGGRLGLKAHLDEAHGFRAHKVYYLREDALGRLWAGTSQGAWMRHQGQWSPFSSADGLPGDDCEGAGFLAEPNGDVWVGTLGGLAHFENARHQGRPSLPSSFILSVQYGNHRLMAPFAGGIRIPHGSASVEFRFTGLTYLYENRVHHQIRLAGLDDEWRTTDLRQVRYPKLPPGSYRFEVRAGMDGQWGAPAVLAFQVLPAWWQTWWFRGLAGLGLLGLGFLAVRLRLRSLRRHNQILEAQVAARTQALAEANKALQALTVTDPLTGLKNRRFLDLTIHDDLAKVNRDYHTLHRGQERRMPLNVDLLFLMADLDHFKRVNDTYGHGAGDLVLQQVRDRLLQAVRETDTVVRWGGEEFLVMARSVDRAQAEIVARRILDLMRAKPFDLGNGETIPMTISLGFALYPFLPDLPPDALSWQEVVQLADRCLYAAKESGRDGWVGLLHGGQDPREAGLFLADPGSILAKGAWDLVCSYPDPAGLQWLRGEPQR